MNVDRRMANGKLDETEPHQAQIYITSAGVKGSFAYEKLIELFVQSIVSPKTTFVWGCDYRVPMLHGLLNKTFVEELKISPTYKEDSFAREYLSINQNLVDIKFTELLGSHIRKGRVVISNQAA